ncbi:MAG TPA: hypothetical protein VF148_03160 [Acidimicrobiia bacterium]
MDIEYPSFGTLVIDGRRYDHDVVIEDGKVMERDKSPSKPLKARYGHTPLSVEEAIPWSGPRLIVGTGYSGSLPVLPEIEHEAKRRNVELLMATTAEAVGLLSNSDEPTVNAILHVTC